LLHADSAREGPSVASQIRNVCSRIALVEAFMGFVFSVTHLASGSFEEGLTIVIVGSLFVIRVLPS
jgi:hypothetical protein